jgi:hypothetical protein
MRRVLKIRPILAGTCFKCHGGEKTNGKLRVDTREMLLKGGRSVHARGVEPAEDGVQFAIADRHVLR